MKYFPIGFLFTIVFCTIMVSPMLSQAHSNHLSMLKITQKSDNLFEVTWKQNQPASKLRITPVFPEECKIKSPPHLLPSNPTVSFWHITCPLLRLSKKIYFSDSSQALSIFLEIEFIGDSAITRLIKSSDKISLSMSTTKAHKQTNTGITDYIQLGIDHIRLGLDHLLFVLGLFVLFNQKRTLFTAVTSFTIGHSLTLTLATFDWIQLRAAPIEFLIAFSLVLLGREILVEKPNQPSSLQRSPWLIPGIFGLVHGLGFASALNHLGLAPNNILKPLISFNVGVELGQIFFIVLLILLKWALSLRPNFQLLLFRKIAPYGIGIAGFVWCIQRYETLGK